MTIEENMLYNSICILSSFISILWIILITYKIICIKKNYYSESAWAVKFKFHYIGLLFLLIILCFIAAIKWFKSNMIFAIIIILISLFLSISIVLYIYFNHYLTIGTIKGEKIIKYKKLRYIFAITVSVIVIILDIAPYLI